MGIAVKYNSLFYGKEGCFDLYDAGGLVLWRSYLRLRDIDLCMYWKLCINLLRFASFFQVLSKTWKTMVMRCENPIADNCRKEGPFLKYSRRLFLPAASFLKNLNLSVNFEGHGKQINVFQAPFCSLTLPRKGIRSSLTVLKIVSPNFTPPIMYIDSLTTAAAPYPREFFIGSTVIHDSKRGSYTSTLETMELPSKPPRA